MWLARLVARRSAIVKMGFAQLTAAGGKGGEGDGNGLLVGIVVITVDRASNNARTLRAVAL